MIDLDLSQDQQYAIIEAHRYFVFRLISSSVKSMRDGRSSELTRREASLFLKSELCVLFVRLLGLGESMSDEEIARSLVDVQRK